MDPGRLQYLSVALVICSMHCACTIIWYISDSLFICIWHYAVYIIQYCNTVFWCLL